MPTYYKWTQRVFADWAKRYGTFPSLAGSYQSVECSLSVRTAAASSAPLPSSLTLPFPALDGHLGSAYAQVGKLFRAQFGASKRVVLSPYVDARKTDGGFGTTAEEHKKNYKAFAIVRPPPHALVVIGMMLTML